MLKQMQTWINQFESREYQTVSSIRMLQTILAIVLVTVTGVAVLEGIGTHSLRSPLLLSPIMALIAASMLLLRRGITVPARIIVPISSFLILSYLDTIGGGVHDVAIIAYPTVLILASLTIGRNAAWFFGGLTILVMIVLGMLELAGILVNPGSFITSIEEIVLIAILVLASASLLHILQRRLDESLQRAYANEQAQIEMNNELRELRDSLVERVTELREKEAALRMNEIRYRALFERTNDGVFILGLDGAILAVNDQVCQMLGYTEQELVGTMPQRILVPEEREASLEKHRMLIEGKALPLYERTYLRKDGTRVPAELNVAMVYDEDGQPLHIQSVVRDITERKRAEEQTRQRLTELTTVNAVSQVAASQLELNALIELTGEKLRQIPNVHSLFIALCDWHTRIISFPYYRLYGSVVESASIPLGQGLTSWVIQNRKPLVIDHDYEQRSAEMGVIRERFEGKPDYRPQTWLGIPMQVGDQVIGILSVHNFEQEHAFSADDVRLWETIAANVGVAIQNAQLYAAAQCELVEREKLIAELESKNAELERFAYTVSHDLKSPLITIRGFLGFLEQDFKAGNLQRLQSDMLRITTATDKMERLLNELLELSRIGRLMNPPADVAFGEIVRDAVALVHGRLTDKHVRVLVAENLPVVHGDRVRLIEVCQNLIDNAVKFMGDQHDPQIEIGVRGTDKDGKPIFFVLDNGIGIASQYYERVFGLFNKLDTHTEGTGVGLALVKRIIEFHGGRIWIESEGFGKGTTFLFTLPQTVKTAP